MQTSNIAEEPFVLINVNFTPSTGGSIYQGNIRVDRDYKTVAGDGKEVCPMFIGNGE